MSGDFSKLGKTRVPSPTPKASKRSHTGYSGGQQSRLTSDWLMSEEIGFDKWAKQDLKTLRARSADFERNDGYMREFQRELENNVIGEHGMRHTPKCQFAGKAGVDDKACKVVADAWKKFSQKENFTVRRTHTRRRYEQLAVRSVCRDGGHLTRLIDGYADNEFRFALQPIRINHLDPNYSVPAENIHMSEEFGTWDRVVAYHIDKRTSRAEQGGYYRNVEKERVPADAMLHLHMADDFEQTQGVPWIAASMIRLRMLSAYEEAEVIAARLQANDITYLEQGEDSDLDIDADDFDSDSEPGSKRLLPKGVTANHVSPTHPNGNYPAFRKTMLRGICAGLPVSYQVMGRDLEGVSFSSIRQGTLSERESYKLIQSWFIDDYSKPIYERWLRMSLLAGALGRYTIDDYERLKHVEIQGRRWTWVDPLRDLNTAKGEIELGVNSRQRVARERGLDFGEIVDENVEDAQLMLPLQPQSESTGEGEESVRS